MRCRATTPAAENKAALTVNVGGPLLLLAGASKAACNSVGKVRVGLSACRIMAVAKDLNSR